MSWPDKYSGIAGLDIAKTLKHLVLQHGVDLGDASFFHESFPQLETITLLLIFGTLSYLHRGLDPTYNGPYIWIQGTPLKIGSVSPELDGEIDTVAMPLATKNLFDRDRVRLNAMMVSGKDKYADWKPPTLKLRFETQFMENEGLTCPAGYQHQLEKADDEDSDLDDY